jgi:hypothetical protein
MKDAHCDKLIFQRGSNSPQKPGSRDRSAFRDTYIQLLFWTNSRKPDVETLIHFKSRKSSKVEDPRATLAQALYST